MTPDVWHNRLVSPCKLLPSSQPVLQPTAICRIFSGWKVTQATIFRKNHETAGIAQVSESEQGLWKSSKCFCGTSLVRRGLPGPNWIMCRCVPSFVPFQETAHTAQDCLYGWEARQRGPQSDRQAEHTLSRMQRSLRLNDLPRGHPPRRTKSPGFQKDESRGMVCAGFLCGDVVTSCSDFTHWAQSDPG